MRDKIKEILKGILEIDEINEDIQKNATRDWDSMHHLQLIVELETEFNVSFEPEDIAEMKSLDIIEEKIQALISTITLPASSYA
jgi:acyl carrier protein